KGNRAFRRFSLRGLAKVHTEFGIVALAHNLLKVAGIRLATFLQYQTNKNAERKFFHFLVQHFYFWTYWTAPLSWRFLKGNAYYSLCCGVKLDIDKNTKFFLVGSQP
ncbi:hypothetical protein P9850_10470, partial [Anoxybacillus rupiensis]|nr:hypothetical protein [Anoxybacillus rupiensis]